MNAHVCLISLIYVAKSDKLPGNQIFNHIFCNKFNKIQFYRIKNFRFYVSYDIEMTMKSHFGVKTVRF